MEKKCPLSASVIRASVGSVLIALMQPFLHATSVGLSLIVFFFLCVNFLRFLYCYDIYLASFSRYKTMFFVGFFNPRLCL